MAQDMAVYFLLFLTTFSLGNGGLAVSGQQLEEKSSKHYSKEKCDRLKTMLEVQVDSYQFACASNKEPPKAEPMDSFLDRVGEASATAYMQIPQA